MPKAKRLELEALQAPISQPRFGSLFIDSGAFTLYNRHVLRSTGKNIGAHGRELAPSHIRFGSGDYSWYDLSKGAEFREYCDAYAAFIKAHRHLRGIYFVNVDVLHNAKLTWQVQQFFEEEHGLRPVPVIHFGTSRLYVDRYIEAGHKLIGLGGSAKGVTRGRYIQWADAVWLGICPAENARMPLVRVHGFALTSWMLMARYPWWSVDSTTWCKVGAYGSILVPKWSEQKGEWDYRRPDVVSFSHKAPQRSQKDQHFDTLGDSHKRRVLRWLAEIAVPLGAVDAKGNGTEPGVRAHHTHRKQANLIFFKRYEAQFPEWPYPLDPEVVCPRRAGYGGGFGL